MNLKMSLLILISLLLLAWKDVINTVHVHIPFYKLVALVCVQMPPFTDNEA